MESVGGHAVREDGYWGSTCGGEVGRGGDGWGRVALSGASRERGWRDRAWRERCVREGCSFCRDEKARRVQIERKLNRGGWEPGKRILPGRGRESSAWSQTDLGSARRAEPTPRSQRPSEARVSGPATLEPPQTPPSSTSPPQQVRSAGCGASAMHAATRRAKVRGVARRTRARTEGGRSGGREKLPCRFGGLIAVT